MPLVRITTGSAESVFFCYDTVAQSVEVIKEKAFRGSWFWFMIKGVQLVMVLLLAKS